jgi:hypothetical protein
MNSDRDDIEIEYVAAGDLRLGDVIPGPTPRFDMRVERLGRSISGAIKVTGFDATAVIFIAPDDIVARVVVADKIEDFNAARAA